MTSITDFIIERTGLEKKPEPNDWTRKDYSMFNTSGVEIEVGEFLYGLVRMIKPDYILETGTGTGISAAYMGLALKENNRGMLWTLEFNEDLVKEARAFFAKLEVQNFISHCYLKVDDFKPEPEWQFDIVFLDTEPNLRFGEFLKFWKNLKPGGIIIIHDLPHHMGQEGTFRPFGEVPEQINNLIRTGELQSLHFQPTRGLYMGQKRSSNFYTNRILVSEGENAK